MDEFDLEKLLSGANGDASRTRILRALVAKKQLFLSLYDYADKQGRRAPAPIRNLATAEIIRAQGIAFVEAHYDAGFVGESLLAVEQALAAGGALPASKIASGGWFEDKSRSRAFQFDPISGRSRVIWGSPVKAPPVIRRLMGDPELTGIISSYYNGANVRCDRVLGEKLVPGEIGDRWHMDSITDQFKVMVLLTSVKATSGPMHYLTGTHHRPSAFDETYHRILNKGYKQFAYPSPNEVSPFLEGLKVCSGSPGNCILFDTIGIHSGTRCEEGERSILSAYYTIDTMKNRMLFSLNLDYEI